MAGGLSMSSMSERANLQTFGGSRGTNWQLRTHRPWKQPRKLLQKRSKPHCFCQFLVLSKLLGSCCWEAPYRTGKHPLFWGVAEGDHSTARSLAPHNHQRLWKKKKNPRPQGATGNSICLLKTPLGPEDRMPRQMMANVPTVLLRVSSAQAAGPVPAVEPLTGVCTVPRSAQDCNLPV